MIVKSRFYPEHWSGQAQLRVLGKDAKELDAKGLIELLISELKGFSSSSSRSEKLVTFALKNFWLLICGAVSFRALDFWLLNRWFYGLNLSNNSLASAFVIFNIAATSVRRLLSWVFWYKLDNLLRVKSPFCWSSNSAKIPKARK